MLTQTSSRYGYFSSLSFHFRSPPSTQHVDFVESPSDFFLPDTAGIQSDAHDMT